MATRCQPGTQGRSHSRSLALLVLLTGCAGSPTLRVPEGYWQDRPGTTGDFPDRLRAGQQAVDVDFEAPAPRQAEELNQRGVQLPRVSQRAADPRTHRDFVDLRVAAVGFGITAGGYLLYCDGLPLAVLVPESQVDLELTQATALSASIYPDRDTALADISASAPASSRSVRYAYYRGAGGALIVPTLFSPATTPRIAQTMLEVRRQLAETTQRELKVLLLSLTGTKVLQGVFSRVLRVGSEPAPRPLSRQSTPRTSEMVETSPARGVEPLQPRTPRAAVPQKGEAGNPRASSRVLAEREVPPEAPLPGAQQYIRDVLLKEHPDLHPRVATEAARGGASVKGPGIKGADVPLLNGGGREVSVHRGEFTPRAIAGHLMDKVVQEGTTEIYLQISSRGASREAFLQFLPKLRNSYPDLNGFFVRIFGPNGEAWWSGVLRGP